MSTVMTVMRALDPEVCPGLPTLSASGRALHAPSELQVQTAARVAERLLAG